MKYKLIMEKGEYALILRKEAMNEYAVVRGLNKDNGDWDWTIGYWYFGKYSQITEAECLMAALNSFRCITEDNYISRSRLKEIAIKALHGLIEDDKESALEFFEDNLELTENEKKFLGLLEDNEDEDS